MFKIAYAHLIISTFNILKLSVVAKTVLTVLYFYVGVPVMLFSFSESLG